MSDAKLLINLWSGRVPIAMSAAAIGLLLFAFTTGWGKGPPGDEGAAAHLWQLLAKNGVDNHGFRYPTLVWWDKQGRMRACACEQRPTYRFVRRELGA